MVANESLTIELFVQEFERSHGMQGRGHAEAKLRDRKAFPIIFINTKNYWK